MKNYDVIDCFLQHRTASGLNLYSKSDKLINYSTCIAQWMFGNDKFILIINKTKYSLTTSKYQNRVIDMAKKAGVDYVCCSNIDINTESLI